MIYLCEYYRSQFFRTQHYCFCSANLYVKPSGIVIIYFCPPQVSGYIYYSEYISSSAIWTHLVYMSSSFGQRLHWKWCLFVCLFVVCRCLSGAVHMTDASRHRKSLSFPFHCALTLLLELDLNPLITTPLFSARSYSRFRLAIRC